MRVEIRSDDLPGRSFCRPDGSIMDNVHVGIQIRRDPADLVRADAKEARWAFDIDVVATDSGVDFRGPAVQGKRGDRFVYLTWGNVGPDDEFEMFRRAKLLLDRIDPALVRSAVEAGCLSAKVSLTDAKGAPRCARLDPPALLWSAGAGPM